MSTQLLIVVGLVGVALAFDYINGFHDAANSIATVVSTRVLSPVQAVMIPIAERHAEYANNVAAQLKAAGVRVEVDARNEKMNAKIREHALQKVPFLLVVGDKEAESGRVNVRTRGKEKTEDMPASDFVQKIKKLIADKSPAL